MSRLLAHDAAEAEGESYEPDNPRAMSDSMPAAHRPLLARRLVPLCVVLIFVTSVAAATLSSFRAPTYAAEADVVYSGQATTSPQDTDRQMATQRVLMQSRPLLLEAAEQIDREPRELAEAVSVSVVDDSAVIRLRVVDERPARALATAEAIIDVYVATVAEQAVDLATGAQERELLESRIAALTEQLTLLDQQVVQLASVAEATPRQEAERQALQDEARLLREQINMLRMQVTDSDIRSVQSRDAPAVQVLAAPSVLEDPVGPQPLRAAAAGLLFGILLSVGLLAVLRSRQQSG